MEKYRLEVEKALISIGLDASANGFTFITDAMEYFKRKDGLVMICDCYRAISKKRHSTFSSVERSIRHSIYKAFNEPNNKELLKKYFGDGKITKNGYVLGRLYIVLKGELMNED